MSGSKETKTPTTRKARRIITISELERLFLADTLPLDKALKTSGFIFITPEAYDKTSPQIQATFVPSPSPAFLLAHLASTVHVKRHPPFYGSFTLDCAATEIF
jgi:hypothetical protein